ncbi:hypothetical protein QOL99_12035 [Deinococcus sp. MIMF12]|uniref:Uncharacterized protein n=1 Tax=Deinococcus rhizophilus TaxID=3049544 RepID=A0ABT7JII5_9DEIO|nr:hypothetical protein [Deinococcus rhizophilus]MDL2344875.1 hypothetical protein [Deinococcus rhizophilus]
MERWSAALAQAGLNWTGQPPPGSLAEVRAALPDMDEATLRRAVWAALGQPRPRSLRLSPGVRSRLAHLTELRDVFSPADAARVGAELASEPGLTADLLAVRPWLPSDTSAREVLTAVLRGEWSGLLALLGEQGPWVYAATVADLQALARLNGELVAAASRADEEAVLDAALASGRTFPALLARLEATDHRRPVPGPAPDLAALEAAFWREAGRQARDAHERWQTRRREGS